MYTSNSSVEQQQLPPRTQLSKGPIYHVYSHYGCRSEDIDRCQICRYLLQPNTYLHPTPQSLLAATTAPPNLPPIHRQLLPTPIEPIRQRIDDTNDLYILPNVRGSTKARREAEDAAIINICLKDKSIDRIVLIDADEADNSEDDDQVNCVRLYDLDRSPR